MQRKVIKFTPHPSNANCDGTMGFDLNPGDTFIELDPGELQAPGPGYVFGSAWGNHMWVPKCNLSGY